MLLEITDCIEVIVGGNDAAKSSNKTLSRISNLLIYD